MPIRTVFAVGLWMASSVLAQEASAPAPSDEGDNPEAAADFAGSFVVESPQGTNVVAFAVDGTQIGGRLEFSGQSVLLAGHCHGRYAHGDFEVGANRGEFEAHVEGDVVTLSLAYEGEKTEPVRFTRFRAEGVTEAPPAPATPEPAAPVPAPTPPAAATATDIGDDATLVGTWVYQSLITSGDASLASEQVLIFRHDGTYSFGTGGSAGGGAGWSYDGGSGEETERGRWRAEDGVVHLQVNDRPWSRIGKYGMTEDRQTMRITYDSGGRKLWSRR